MNTPTLPASAAPGVPSAAILYRARIDDACCKVVNQAISVQSNFNTICAVEYLKSHNVTADVIERVLSHPEARRS